MKKFKTIKLFTIDPALVNKLINECFSQFLNKKNFYSSIKLVNPDNTYYIKDKCVFVNDEVLINFSNLFLDGIVIYLKDKSGECILSGMIQAEISAAKIAYVCH